MGMCWFGYFTERVMKVVLVSCVKSKLAHPAPAAELYTSSLFRGSLNYAKRLKPDRVFILSALHGLVEPTQVIAPYEETLNGKPKAVLQQWADRVAIQLSTVADLDKDHFVFLAGNNYRKFLLPKMSSYEVPLEGKGLGKQLSFYASQKP